MRSVSVRLCDLEKVTIPLGFVGENIFTKVYIDCKKVFDEHPDAVPTLAVVPPQGDAYPAVVTKEGDMVIWEITASDLIYKGSGEMQLAFIEDEMIGKTWSAKTKVYKSIEPSGEVPEPIQNWLTQASATLALVDEAIELIPQTIDEEISKIIDDTAGTGDTNKVWSASKSSELKNEINVYDDTNLFLSATWQQGYYASMGTFSNTTITTSDKRISTQIELADGVTSIQIKLITEMQFILGLFDADGTSLATVSSMRRTDYEYSGSSQIKYVRISYGPYPNAVISSFAGEIALFINGYSTMQSIVDKIKKVPEYQAKVDSILPFCDTNLFLSATWEQGLFSSFGDFTTKTILANNGRLSTDVTLPDGVNTIQIRTIGNNKFKATAFNSSGTLLATLQDFQSETWDYTSTTAIKYIRISYGHNDNSNISAYTEEVILFINGYSTLQGISGKLKSLISDYGVKVGGLNGKISAVVDVNELTVLDSSNLELGTLSNGSESSSDVRVRTKTMFFVPSSILKMYCKNDSIEYMVVVYDKDGTWKGNSAWMNGNNTLDLTSINMFACKMRMLFKFKTAPYDMTDMNLDSISTIIVPQPNYGGNIRLTLMSHNCGHFNYGQSTGYSGDDLQEKVQEWKNMIVKHKPDIIFAQECSSYFDADSTVPAYDTIYKPLMPFTYFVAYGRVMSKVQLGAVWQIDLSVTYEDESYSRQAGCAIAVVDGVEIVLCSMHLNPGHGSPYDEVRELQKAILIDALSGYDHVIIGGDFNASADSFYDDFVTAGYECANHGYFGTFNTTTDNQKIDNILVKGFSFYNAVVNSADNCTSDHIPIVAEAHISAV